ncbi:reverse transcriptase [Gossypium australe]|uniref:Reverse transcriptase n=1 Tax=Gossypium australe TaxID=47621 RepID=A0A5B6VN86_9ROSI|nr:reverse transcriptase [Gossypium australe]
MGPTKAPGADGFPALFFQRYWHIVGRDITDFCMGRLITDNVLLTYEILHTINQKRSGKKGVMAVKLDMSKAYDRVEWKFLEEVMTKMGFACEWVELLKRCVSTVSYAVNINGGRGNLFLPYRGLRQVDPLSPFLFLICSEGLSSLMRTIKRRGLLKGVKASRQGPAISHLLFADDYILFGEASNKGANILKDILQDYEICSGQCVNFSKSIVFFSPNTSEENKAVVSNLLGVRMATNPEKYLGLPNMTEKRRGLGFRNMAQFNIVMLAKQGWRLLENPNSLVAQVFKAKYFPKSNFLNSQLGNRNSYVWRSTWVTRGSNDNKVADLINCQTREWNREVVEYTFGADEADKILRIPLAKYPHDDLLAWRGEPTGVFSVKSSYKLLQSFDPNTYAIQLSYIDFYKKMWCIDLPTKLKINMWKASWNYLPTRVNLLHKKLTTDASCPRCGLETETLNHLLRECPISVEMWSYLSEVKLTQDPNADFKQWLTSSVALLSLDLCKEMAIFMRNYIQELDGVKNKAVKLPKVVSRWKHPPYHVVKINFDGAYDMKEQLSASGIVARDSEGEVLASKSKIHKNVASAFAAEALAC